MDCLVYTVVVAENIRITEHNYYNHWSQDDKTSQTFNTN